MNKPSHGDMEFWEYQGTPEGDRLTTLAAAYRMSFEDKIRWSETCELMAQRSSGRMIKSLKDSMSQWPMVERSC